MTTVKNLTFWHPGYEEYMVIIGACALIFLIIILRQKAFWIVNLVLRAATGILFVLVCNTWMDKQHIIGKVGLNVISLLTSASLGIPGVMGLYGIRFLINL